MSTLAHQSSVSETVQRLEQDEEDEQVQTSRANADLSGVPAHAGAEADHLSQPIGAVSLTAGRNILFRIGADDPSSESLSSARAHLTTVQRHSSWEHQLLGDADPTVLASFGTWEDLIKQTESTKKAEKTETEKTGLLASVRGFGGFSSLFGGAKPQQPVPQQAGPQAGPQVAEAEVTVQGVGKLNKAQVMHNIVQEMNRLKSWQEKPPLATSTSDALAPAGKDPVFDVVTVQLPGDGLLITYGEMNTLADFYGNLEVMKAATAKTRREVVQSVRKETFLRLKEIYDKLNASLTKAEQATEDVQGAQQSFGQKKLAGTTFAGAATPDFISSTAGQADLLAGDKPLVGQGTGAQGNINKYGATLARNACHFVPESWHSWAAYHDTARTAAGRAYALRAEVRRLKATLGGDNVDAQAIDTQIAEKSRQAAEAANEALLNNGFGDHYLQDSYASGHMINKTQIMQWYVEFIDKSKEWNYFREENWRKVQQMAYNQPGLADKAQYDKNKVKDASQMAQVASAPRNPQMVENIAADDWKVRFDALGLTVPASLRTPGSMERKLVEWWQLTAANTPALAKMTLAQLVTGKILDRPNLVRMTLNNLMRDGIVRKDPSSVEEVAYILRADYVPRDVAKFQAALSASRGSEGDENEEQRPPDDSAYQRMAAAVTYGDYFQFMQSGFLQKATNALHDTFCKGGLDVLAPGGQAFKVYGDDAMFNKGSAIGVMLSGQTANMSRDAILSIINTNGDGGNSVGAIMARLPDRVSFDVVAEDKTVSTVVDSIEAWHNSSNRGYLKDLCFTKVFPGMTWSAMQKFVPGVVGSELGTISVDVAKHGADAF